MTTLFIGVALGVFSTALLFVAAFDIRWHRERRRNT